MTTDSILKEVVDTHVKAGNRVLVAFNSGASCRLFQELFEDKMNPWIVHVERFEDVHRFGGAVFQSVFIEYGINLPEKMYLRSRLRQSGKNTTLHFEVFDDKDYI